MQKRLGRLAAQCIKPSISLDVWQRCNIQCVFCPSFVRKDVESTITWTAESVSKLFSKDDEICAVYFAGSFGEPILNPELPEIVRYLSSQGTDVAVSTNGQALTVSLAERLIDAGVKSFNISTVGLHKSTTERFMQGIHYELTMVNIKRLAQLARRRGVHVGISVVGVSEALEHLQETIEFAHRNTIKEIRLLSILDCELSHTGKQENPAYRAFIEENDIVRNVQVFRALWKAAKRRSEELGIILAANDPYKSILEREHSEAHELPNHLQDKTGLGTGTSRLCLDPFLSAVVTWEGNVVPCCSESSYPVGNLSDKPFREIWNRGEHFRVRQGLLTGNLHPMCAPCTRAPRAPADLTRLLLALRILDRKFDPGLLGHVFRRRHILAVSHDSSVFDGVPASLMENLSTFRGLWREFVSRLRNRILHTR